MAIKILHDGIHALLDMQPGMDVIATAKNEFAGVQLAGKLMPDIILMDISMPVMADDEGDEDALYCQAAIY